MNPFLGQVVTFAFNFTPTGWAPCDGRLLPVAQNKALFSLLGTIYGGDGVNTFAVPSLSPVTADGPFYYIALQGVFPPRS